MKILALESSAVSASVALTEDEKLVAQSFQNCGLTHSRTLLPMVENLLANCGVSLADVDAIAVAHGPGSFTGVRIGVATVKGLALGADKPCLGVSTLEAMAWGARALGGDLCCVMDARAGQVYNALFTVEDGRVRRLCDDRAIKLTELAEEIGEAPYFLVGDGADLCYNTIKENCTGLRLAPAELRFATGFGVATAALPLFREGKSASSAGRARAHGASGTDQIADNTAQLGCGALKYYRKTAPCQCAKPSRKSLLFNYAILPEAKKF